MRFAAWLVALFAVTVGIVGLVWPETLMTVRRYYLSPVGLSAIGGLRLAMGLVLILFAPASRAPKTLRALGAVMCVQGLAQELALPLFGIDRARAILEWEGMHIALLRIGAAVALASGGFVAFAVTPGRRSGAK